MTKFEKFAEFVMEWAIFPLVLTFVTGLIPVIVWFVAGVELMWLVNTCAVLTCITAVWLVIFLVCFVATRIIDWRKERKWIKEHYKG